MLFLLLPTLLVGVYLAWYYTRKAALDQIRRRLNTRNYQKQKQKIPSLSKMNRKQRMLTLYTIAASVCGSLLSYFFLSLPPVIGFVIGGVLPAFLLSLWSERWMDRYEEDVERAIDYGAGHFAAGHTVEQWIIELPDELEGPLRSVFLKGAAQMRENLPAIDFLEWLGRTTPSNYFEYVIGGIIDNSDTGDMNTYIHEIREELSHRQRYNRIMRQQRKEAMQLLFAMSGFPVFLYLVAKNVVNQIIYQSFWNTLLFGVWMVGYVVLIWFARKSASVKQIG